MSDAPPSERLIHFRWDLDKIYIQTEFDTVRELVATFRQKAEQKRTVPGARTLLRELLLPSSEEVPRRVMFISGSPRQMRRVLTEKLQLDGIEWEQMILKPNLSNLLLGRFRAIRSQVGYKLSALLESRIRQDGVTEVLFGDDSEQDAFIYSVYADLVEGRLDTAELGHLLHIANIEPRERERALALASELDRRGDPADPLGHRVKRIYIHLERRSPVARFAEYGGRVVPVYNYFQAALVLFGDGLISPQSLLRVIDAMGRDGYTPVRLANSLQDLARRGFVQDPLAEGLREQLGNARALLEMRPSRFMEGVVAAVGRVRLPKREPPEWIDHITYRQLAPQGKYKREPLLVRGIRLLD